MKAYQSAVLRYVHSSLTQEFVNIGVVVFAEPSFLRTHVSRNFSRVSHFFNLPNVSYIRNIALNLEVGLNQYGEDLGQGDLFKKGTSLKQILHYYLPKENALLQWEETGAGIAEDLEETTRRLYREFVGSYLKNPHAPRSRSAQDVWKESFQGPFRGLKILDHLKETELKGSLDRHLFQRTWEKADHKTLNIIEPLSLDYLDEETIAERARHWLGLGFGVSDSKTPHRFTFLLGEPEDKKLKKAATKAMNLINKIPNKVDFVREGESKSYAADLAAEFTKTG